MILTFPNVRRRHSHQLAGIVGFAALAYVAVRIATTLLSQVITGEAKTDWVPLYTVGTLVRQGNGSQLFDHAAQADAQSRLFGVTGDLNLFQHPPSVAYIVAPLTWFSFEASYFVWLGVNLTFAASLLFVMWRYLEPMPRSQRKWFVLAAGLSAPLTFLIFMGQTDLLVLSAILGAYGMMSRGHSGWAGLLLAASLLKPHFTASFVLLLIVKREWKALGSFAIAGSLVLGFPFLIEGPGLISAYSDLMSEFLSSRSDIQVNAQGMINIRGTVASVYEGSALAWVIPLVIVSVAVVALAIQRWVEESVVNQQSWALALVLPIIVSPHVHFHSLVFLLAALTLYVRAMAANSQTLKTVYIVIGHLTVTVLWDLTGELVGLVSIVVLAFFLLCVFAWPRQSSVEDRSPVPASWRPVRRFWPETAAPSD